MNGMNIPFFQNKINSIQHGVAQRKTQIAESQNGETNVFAQAAPTGDSEKQRLRIEISDLQQQLAGLKSQLNELKATKLALAEQNQQFNAQPSAATNTGTSGGVRNILGGMC